MRADKCLECTRYSGLGNFYDEEMCLIMCLVFVLQKLTLIYFVISSGSFNSLKMWIVIKTGRACSVEMLYGFRLFVKFTYHEKIITVFVLAYRCIIMHTCCGVLQTHFITTCRILMHFNNGIFSRAVVILRQLKWKCCDGW
jgi:hypothetical protein